MVRKIEPSKRRAAPSLGAPLYERTNGFLLGSFLALLRLGFARRRFALHRARMLEFLSEIGVTAPIPVGHGEFAAAADTVQMGITTDVLNRLFSNDFGPLRQVRDIGLGLVDRMPRLKEFFIRQASGLSGDTPRLLRGEAI